MGSKSNTSRKPAVQPDVSAKTKENYSTHDAVIAIVIVIFVVVGAVLLAVGFRNNYEKDLENAKAEAESLKAEFSTKISELATREQELIEREQKLSAREAKVSNREEKAEEIEGNLSAKQLLLESDRADLTDEEEEFYAQQRRIKELCEALLAELTPENE